MRCLKIINFKSLTFCKIRIWVLKCTSKTIPLTIFYIFSPLKRLAYELRMQLCHMKTVPSGNEAYFVNATEKAGSAVCVRAIQIQQSVCHRNWLLKYDSPCMPKCYEKIPLYVRKRACVCVSVCGCRVMHSHSLMEWIRVQFHISHST